VVPLTVPRLALLALCLGAGASIDPPSSSDDLPDARYLDSGVDPSRILSRPEGKSRALETRGGYDAAGAPLYYQRFGALGPEGFAGGAAGRAARAQGDRFRVFFFPRRQGRPQSVALSELRQDPLFDTTPGYRRHNPLGLWRLAFVRYTPAVFSRSDGLRLLEELRQRNGTDLDGTPLLKHVSELQELAARGFAAIEQRPEDGSRGSPWVIWRPLVDPRRDGIPSDAYLMLVARVDGVPVDREIEQNFLALSETGDFCMAPMPRLPAFAQPLPIPGRLPAGKLVELHERPFLHRFHPDLPPTSLWGYEGTFPGPIVTLRRGEPVVVRSWNQLPAEDSRGFGRPWTLCELQLPLGLAGFRATLNPPGQVQEQNLTAARSGTGCYGDAAPGFRAPNSARGLAGIVEIHDEFDSGNENDPSPGASRLPGGAFDVPLVLGDRQFDVSLDHALSWDAFVTDAAPGAWTTVNGAVQPYFRVARRKYRFRILNAGPSRFYELALGSRQMFTVLGLDAGPLEAPLRSAELRLAPGRLADVVIDFSEVALRSEVLLENLLTQETGKGPIDGPPSPERDRRMIKFIVDRDAPDPSRIPARWNRAPTDGAEAAPATRTFVLENVRGAWTINGNLYDSERADLRVKCGTTQVWILKNASTDWTLPVPGSSEGLRPGGEVRLLLRFGGKPGRYMLPVGNPIQADLGLMIHWDLVP
jgi:FtsP/CotA-like multicopper oxidase with cupredoxin domain